MNIILLGPSGSGKGVQAKLLVEKFGFEYLVMSDLLKKSWEVRPDVKEIMTKGGFVPNEVTFEILKDFFGDRVPDNILFDGYPRSIEQYNLFKTWLLEKDAKMDLVIDLEVSQEELIKRLSARRLDPITGKIYNLITDKPPVDIDLNSLVQRDDDKPEAIAKRLEWYHGIVEPLIAHLKETGVNVASIDGDRQIETIHQELAKIVEGLSNAG